MSTFQESKEHIEQKMLLKLMKKIEDEPNVSQRYLATELGVALGLMNTYLKRCIKKGWVKANQVPARRLAYFLTPEGFKEKGRMVKDYISGSLSFFRDARKQSETIFIECRQRNWNNIALVGEGDLTEIVDLVAHSNQINAKRINMNAQTQFALFDAILITDSLQPQKIYDDLKKQVSPDKLLFLPLLHISTNVDQRLKESL